MKQIHILGLALFLSITAQPQSSSASIQYNKNIQPALRIELADTIEDVKATILQKLKQTGYKPATDGYQFRNDSKTDGFYVFNNVRLTSMSTQVLDMYFKVVPGKNEENKNNNALYLLLSKGNGNFFSPENDSVLWNNAGIFLNGFSENAVTNILDQDIKKQEVGIVESRKKLSTLQTDEKGLEDKIRKLQEDLWNNQSSQADQEFNIVVQERSLQTLRVKRKV